MVDPPNRQILFPVKFSGYLHVYRERESEHACMGIEYNNMDEMYMYINYVNRTC